MRAHTFNPEHPGNYSATGKPLHPFCKACDWRKGGVDSWDGTRCKCGESSMSFPELCRLWNAAGDAIKEAAHRG